MKKRGQFYLVAGILIIFIIVGLISIVNYAQKSQIIVVDHLKGELKIETQKVLEYEIKQSTTQMRTYGIDYSSHLGNEIELYFIIGADPDIHSYKYVNGDESDADSDLTIDYVNNKIIFNLNEIDYEFDLLSSENFYYLISQEIQGEYFIATG